MSEYPKDGSTFVTESIDRIAYRWAKYKPDGARQMGKPGRWQKQVWSGDYFKWENCEDPVGEISPPVEDGPITKAFKQAGALEHWRQEVGKLHSQIARLREALEAIRDIEPEQFNAYPADWQEQIAACGKCQSYKDHPLFRGICDTHRQPMYRRDDHDAHQVRTLGYRAKGIARDALAALSEQAP